MEQFQNAAQGLKKMFIAQVGVIICTVIALIPVIDVVGVIGSIVFSIISLVGLNQAGKDIGGCKSAFTFTIAQIIVNAISNFFDDGIVKSIFSIAVTILSLMIIYLVCNSVSSVLSGIGYQDIADKGMTVWKINVICCIISVIVDIITLLPFIGPVLAVIGAVIIAIISVVGEILYMIFLNSSSKALGA